MPRIDTGPTDGPPGRQLPTVWVTLTEAEAVELLEALRDWAESIGDWGITSGWHTHTADAEGHELTDAAIAVGEPKVPAR